MTRIPKDSASPTLGVGTTSSPGAERWMATEPIAIIGLGCRFPGARSPEAFWRLMCDGGEAITEVPPDRWDADAFYDPTPGALHKMNTRWGGFLEQVDQFDAHFFGISPREAMRMDPQQRLVLEVAWEALEDAGQVLERLAGTRTGVFIGLSSNDYGRLQMDPRLSDAYMATGNAGSIAANRLSYVFNWRGPSLTVDTACSSSLVAVHLACCSLWHGESTLALAGGVNVILSPTFTITFTKAGMMSPDGRCKAFDAGANGYVRGEGAGIVVLKPLSTALADGDPIYAVIRGSAVNQDGRSDGLTVPSQEAQEAVVLEACRRAGVSPGQIDYVEAHGTGTPVGDPIEARALGNVLAIDRPPERSCALGSVKTNIAHLEAASGIAGLIKVALMLKHRQIPPSLHFRKPNPLIPFDELPLQVQTTLSPWPETAGPALAGVNSFGFGGTNAHVILQEAPQAGLAQPPRQEPASGQAHLLPLSARSRQALQALAQVYKDLPAAAGVSSLVSWQDVCYTASVRRNHHDHRLAVVFHSQEELVEHLEAFLRGEVRPGMACGRKNPDRRSPLVFVFPGQGPQWWGMGRQLLDQEPVFRETLEQCDALLRRHADWSLLQELKADESRSRLADTAIAQPALFALQVALAALWRAWGIVPDAVVGHSMGEVAAAHVAGVLSLEDAVRVIFHRGRLMQQATGQGKMAAVNLSMEEAEQLLVGYEHRLSIAAINSPTSAVLSGEPAALGDVLQALQQKEIFFRFLPVNYAFHSHQMEPFQGELVQSLARLRPQPAFCRIVSTVTGRAADGQDFAAAYWGRNLREPVRFAMAIDGLAREGYDLFLELSPHPTLSGAVAQCLSACGKEGTVLPSLRRGEEEGAAMLGSLGALYALGYPVDWSRLYATGGRCVRLPSYPWQRERCWLEIDAAELGGQAWLAPSGTKRHPLLGRHLPSAHPVWEVELGRQAPPYLDDHRIQGAVLLPATAYVEMALAAATEAFGAGARVLSELDLQRALFLPEGDTRKVQVVLSPNAQGEASFHIYSKPGGAEQPDESWTCHVTGKIRLDQDHSASPTLEQVAIEEIRLRCPQQVIGKDFYAELREQGFHYGPAFQGIAQLWRCDGEALGQLRTPQGLESDVEAYHLHPALLDACLQVLAAAVPVAATGGSRGGVYLPVRIDRIRLYDRPGRRGWSHARLRPYVQGSGTGLEGEVRLLDDAGRPLVDISGLRLQQVDRSATPAPGEDLRDWLYELVWELKTRAGQASVHLPADYMLPPQQIAAPLQLQLARSSAPAGLEPYDALGAQGEALSTAYILQACQQLGWELRPHQRVSTAGLAAQWGVASQHQRLLGRLLERLAEEGVLRNVGCEWEVCREPVMVDPEELRKALLAQYPACEAELTLLGRCGRHLAAVLRGECDPLQLLFPAGSLTTLEQLYQDSPYARAYNMLVQEAILAALEGLPEGRTLRVLEIGAGTGGLTAYVLPKLPLKRTEYVFTDVSNLFLLHGQRKFGAYPFVRYQLLDIERDPEAQGCEAHAFDVILASHVLHATSDLRRTLRHVQQLLTSQGLLVLLEGESLHGIYDLVFGMMEGWWKFTDADLRPSHPLLSQRQWREVLTEVGFTEAVAVPQRETRGEGDWSRQVVMLARSPHVARDAEPEEAVSVLPEQLGSWLIFADSGGVGQQLAELLGSHNERCVMVSAAETYAAAGSDNYQLNPARPEEFHRLLVDALGSDRPPCRGVLHLWSLQAATLEETTVASLEAAQVLGCGSVLHLVQALTAVDWAESPRLWMVTCGTQAVEVGAEPVSVAQSPLWGLRRVIAIEHPELRCTTVDLSPRAAPEEIHALFQELWAGDREDQIALRGEARYVQRLVQRAPDGTAAKRRIASADQPFRLEISKPGILDHLTLRATTRRAPGPGEVEIQVYAAGLNFLDVLSALGLRPDQPDNGTVQLGIECAGKIVALGAGIKDLHVGDEVIAIAPSCFGAFVTTAAAFVVPKPAGLGFEEAATIPVAFLTAYYALHHLGRLGKGERVLIHAAAGGVGLAAVQLAQHAGAEIFVTAGSPGKREFLRSLGIEHVMDSRSLAFADEVLERTDGQGVDVVLNSLAGEAIPKSLSTLRANGRFLEIGKRDIYQNSRLGMGYLRNNVSFFAIDLVPMFRERPEFCALMLRELVQGFASGTLKPLPFQVFPISEAESAFRYMAQAKHIGKIVVSLQEQEVFVAPSVEATARFRPDGTYLITGGLGGFGLAVAQWMVEQGARHLVLMGRNEPSAAARATLEAMRRAGAEVRVAQADVTEEGQVAGVVGEIGQSMPPLRGVIHAAMVLDDAALRQLNLDRLRKVMAPKLSGAWHLHTLTLSTALDFFVLFSSSAALVGSPGQANYVAANVGLDALAHSRRAQGLPALSINWGRLAEVGYVARHDEIGQRLERLGVQAFTAKQAVTILGQLLQLNPIQMGAMRVDWQQWGQSYRAAAESPFLSHLMRGVEAEGRGNKASLIRDTLRVAPPGERQKLLEAYLRQEVARSLRLDPSQIDVQQSLDAIGLDSLMGLELKHRFETDLGVDLPMATLMQDPTISQLASKLLALLPAPSSTSSFAHAQAADVMPPLTHAVSQEDAQQVVATVDRLSDEEVDALLHKLLAEGDSIAEEEQR